MFPAGFGVERFDEDVTLTDETKGYPLPVGRQWRATGRETLLQASFFVYLVGVSRFPPKYLSIRRRLHCGFNISSFNFHMSVSCLCPVYCSKLLK